MDFITGQTVKSKKKHPCGGDTWEILRTGADIKIKCCQCGHIVILPRRQIEKQFKLSD